MDRLVVAGPTRAAGAKAEEYPMAVARTIDLIYMVNDRERGFG